MNMGQDAVQVRDEWNYSGVLLGLLVGIFVQSIVLPCLCADGTIKAWIAGAVDAMVVARLIVARICRERGRGWILYALLPVAIVPVIELAVRYGLPK